MGQNRCTPVALLSHICNIVSRSFCYGKSQKKLQFAILEGVPGMRCWQVIETPWQDGVPSNSTHTHTHTHTHTKNTGHTGYCSSHTSTSSRPTSSCNLVPAHNGSPLPGSYQLPSTLISTCMDMTSVLRCKWFINTHMYMHTSTHPLCSVPPPPCEGTPM